MFWLDCCFFFFCKQKTAYEMRISDWSSDVCSSDLISELGRRRNVRSLQLCRTVARCSENAGPDRSGADHRDADVVRRQFDPERLRYGDHRIFRRGVDAPLGQGDEAGDRAGVHDMGFTRLRDHARQECRDRKSTRLQYSHQCATSLPYAASTKKTMLYTK